MSHSKIAKFLAVSVLLTTATLSVAAPPHFEGFEDPAWVANQTDNWQNFGGATIARVPSGTNLITSSDGVAHAELTTGNGPFTRLGGYSSTFGPGFVASLDVYLDPAWSDGSGFDYSVAASNQSGSHLRDFIWHVGVVSGDLLVNASNNTDSTFNAFKLTNENAGNNYTISTAGWYTLEHVFYDNSGDLAVDLNLYDSVGTELYSITRSNVADDIATIVGGNRYGWFTYNNIADLAIDNTSLQAVPEPTGIALASIGFLVLGRCAIARRKRR